MNFHARWKMDISGRDRKEIPSTSMQKSYFACLGEKLYPLLPDLYNVVETAQRQWRKGQAECPTVFFVHSKVILNYSSVYHWE